METLIFFVVWGALIFLMMRFGCGAHVMGRGHEKRGRDDHHASLDSEVYRWTPPETDVDPVCGKTVRTDRAKSSVYSGMVFYFCSRECRERFEAAPELYPRSADDDGTTTEEHANV